MITVEENVKKSSYADIFLSFHSGTTTFVTMTFYIIIVKHYVMTVAFVTIIFVEVACVTLTFVALACVTMTFVALACVTMTFVAVACVTVAFVFHYNDI
jgi:hypothetical protein